MANHLTQEDRYHIHALKNTGKNNTEIANELGKHKSTISRELKRNSGQRGYRATQAHKLACLRKEEAPKFIKINIDLIIIISFYLEEKWSPEQISGWLFKEKKIEISHEKIYQLVLEDKQCGGILYTHLRWQIKRKKRYGTKAHDRRGQIVNKVSIEKRAEIVDKKSRRGDFEGDLVIGKNHKHALVTLVDRKTKLVKIIKVKSKKAEEVSEAICKVLKGFKIYTLTFDNGKEFSYHEKIAKVLNTKVFFAHPYCSHERGLNENTNGLIRQYFPKKSDFTKLSALDISKVENALNNRPRKTLNFKTPNEMYYGIKTPRT